MATERETTNRLMLRSRDAMDRGYRNELDIAALAQIDIHIGCPDRNLSHMLTHLREVAAQQQRDAAHRHDHRDQTTADHDHEGEPHHREHIGCGELGRIDGAVNHGEAVDRPAAAGALALPGPDHRPGLGGGARAPGADAVEHERCARPGRAPAGHGARQRELIRPPTREDGPSLEAGHVPCGLRRGSWSFVPVRACPTPCAARPRPARPRRGLLRAPRAAHRAAPRPRTSARPLAPARVRVRR